MKNVSIYYLSNPGSNVPKYIGKTINTLSRRLYLHILEAKTTDRNTYKLNWIRSLLKKEESPEIHLIEICSEESWKEREIYWISKYNSLTNSTKGGESFTVKNNQKVLQYNMDGVFLCEYESIFDAMRINKFKKGTIDSALQRNPERAFCKNYLWRYSRLGKSKYLQPYIDPKTKPVRIIDIATGQRHLFESINEGLTFFNLKRCGNINRCIQKQVLLYNRYYIMYIN